MYLFYWNLVFMVLRAILCPHLFTMLLRYHVLYTFAQRFDFFSDEGQTENHCKPYDFGKQKYRNILCKLRSCSILLDWSAQSTIQHVALYIIQCGSELWNTLGLEKFLLWYSFTYLAFLVFLSSISGWYHLSSPFIFALITNAWSKWCWVHESQK